METKNKQKNAKKNSQKESSERDISEQENNNY